MEEKSEDKTIKINITSGIVEKGIDLAKDFLGRLITPAIEEAGLLIMDKVRMYRFRNQVAMLEKARLHCEKYKINPKTIPLKLIVPLLESAGLEEDVYLQDKWALLLTNMVDSKQNIDNHVLPAILSQLSRQEFDFLERNLNELRLASSALENRLAEYEENRITKISLTTEAITLATQNYQRELTNVLIDKDKISFYQNQIEELNDKLYRLNTNEESNAIKREYGVIPFIKVEELEKLEEFELVNLIRLGLIKERAKPSAKVTPTNSLSSFLNPVNRAYGRNFTGNIKVDIVSSVYLYAISQLGEKLIDACSETNLYL